MNAEKPTILAVDDEEDILELIKYNLQKEKFSVLCKLSGEEAIKASREEAPDVILLDIMLPGVNGLDVCRVLKNDGRTKDIPVIMLTAKGEESDVVMGLELGADDYIIKPFSPRVLVARIKAVLRRRSAGDQKDAPVKVGEITVDPQRHLAFCGDKQLELTATEFALLHFFTRRPGWVFTRNQIIEAVKGSNYPVTDRSVDVQVVGLRKKLGSAGNRIQTVRGVGYRLMADD